MDFKPIFTTIIAFDKLDLDNTVLEKYCRNQISTFEKDKDSSISQSTFFNLNDKELQPLLTEIKYKVNYMHKELGFADDLHQEQGRRPDQPAPGQGGPPKRDAASQQRQPTGRRVGPP